MGKAVESSGREKVEETQLISLEAKAKRRRRLGCCRAH